MASQSNLNTRREPPVMDKGEWLRQGFYVKPTENGSFVVHSQSEGVGTIGRAIAFSNVDDLLEFIKDERDGFALAQPKPGTWTPSDKLEG